jgi:hypothetical protein
MVKLLRGHTVPVFKLMTGNGCTVKFTVAEFVQVFAAVPTTVKVVLTGGETVSEDPCVFVLQV